MRYYLGIDGGGSKTTALLCDENAEKIAVFVGGGVNFYAVGMEEARRNLKQTLDGLFAKTGPLPVSAAFIGMSALSERAPEALTKEFCGGILPCETVGMDSDVFIGLEAMKKPDPVAFVISGTGSMAAGRLPGGKTLHTGGWGYLPGDEGSGYALALDALRAGICGAEGSGAQTMLTQKITEYYHIDRVDALIDLFYDPAPPRSEIARFSPVLFDCANAGDAVALSVVRRQAAALANTAAALLRRMPEGTPLGLWGGVFQHEALFRACFSELIVNEFPGTTPELLRYPPEYGAVFAAMKADPVFSAEADL